MSSLRVVVMGLALAALAVYLDLRLLRSFEFIGVPASFAPAPGLGLPEGSWPPASALAEATPDPAWLTALEAQGVTRPARPGYALPRLPLAATPTARGVTIVITDGLRLDMSRDMPAWRRLAARGEEEILQADFPCFSRVGYAGILTGALPRVHGYLSNRRRAPALVPSVFDVARASGLRTRIFQEHHTWFPGMFPLGFDEVRPLEDLLVTGTASPLAATAPHLTLVYLSEPDLTSHEFGGTSPEYRAKALEVDSIIARIAAAIDLQTDALFLCTDHGHVDRGGHGGAEDAVRRVPAIALGQGASLSGATSLRDIGVRAGEALGLAPLPGPRIAAPKDDPESRVMRLCAGFVAVFLLARLLGGQAGPQPLDLAAALLAMAAFVGIYALRGFPFSFSIANKAGEIPRLMLEILVMATMPILVGARLRRSGPRYAAALLRMGAVAFAVALGAAGTTAVTAIHHPLSAYLVHISATFLVAAGALSPILVRVVKNHGDSAEE